MKKHFTKTIILFLFGISQIFASDWEQQSSGSSATIRGLSFINASTGWAAGNSGLLLKTINGGEDWSVLPSPVNATFRDIFFINENIGFIGNQSNSVNPGATNTLRKTTDGGSTWTIVDGFTTSANSVWSIHFLDKDLGFVAGGSTGNGYVKRTRDGGNSWTTVLTGSDYFTDVFFVDADHGWASNGVLSTSEDLKTFRTTDGGSTWSTIVVAPGTGRQFNAIYFIDANTGWAVGGDGAGMGYIYKSTDGGLSWSQTNIGTVQGHFQDVVFTDASTGWAVGPSGKVYHSIDGGGTWAIKSLSNPNISLEEVEVISSSMAYVAGSNGGIFKFTVPVPSPIINMQPKNATTCINENAVFEIEASNAVAYQWQIFSGSKFVDLVDDLNYSGATTSILHVAGTVIPDEVHKYRCIVIGELSQEIISDTVILDLFPLPKVGTNYTRMVACSGSEVVLEAFGGVSYEWSHDAGNTSIVTVSPSITTDYSVTVIDANGCYATAKTEVVVLYEPIASFTEEIDGLTVHFDFSTSSGEEIIFDFGDGGPLQSLVPGITDISHTYREHGVYTMTVHASNECGQDVYSKELSLIVTSKPGYSNFNVNLYPNPSNGLFKLDIQNTLDPIYVIRVSDMNGRIILHKEGIANKSLNDEIDLTSFPKGLYNFTISSNSGSYSRLLSVQ